MRVCHLPKSAKRMLIVELPIAKSVVRLRQRSLVIERAALGSRMSNQPSEK